MYVIHNWSVTLFLFSSKRESPHKSKIILLFSLICLKLLRIVFTLFIGINAMYGKMMGAQDVVRDTSLISNLQEYTGFMHS